MVEFHDFEHTGVSGTTKLTRNKCQFIKIESGMAENDKKAKIGPTATSTPHGARVLAGQLSRQHRVALSQRATRRRQHCVGTARASVSDLR